MKHELKANHLAKNYGKNKIVEDVSFRIANNEVVGLLGPNGAGKTTCFYMVLGLIPCSQGNILLDNIDISSMPVHERAKLGIGYLPQEPSVFRKLTVYENINSIIELRKDINKSKKLELLERLLEEFGLQRIKNSLGVSLSGGERRRVEIARTLAIEPKFILLDEPFSGVDPKSIADLKQIIIKLKQQNIGIFITDHNVRDTLAIIDRAYVIYNGVCIAEGNSKSILNNEEVIKVYLGKNFAY